MSREKEEHLPKYRYQIIVLQILQSVSAGGKVLTC
jgi:hypothetical protein